MRIYAIGDIHGQLDMLLAAYQRIAADREVCRDQTAPVLHLGDYTDRGPHSSAVVQTLIDGKAAGQPWLFIKGNHDRMFTGFLNNPHDQDTRLHSGLTWFHPRLGGDKTLESYGVIYGDDRPRIDVNRAAVDVVPQSHRDFLENLPLYYETPDLLLVHAGVLPGIPLAEQHEDDLIWIRDGFLEDDRDHGKLVVHGHTALEEPMHFGNRIDLDSGAGYFRPLTVAVFEECQCWVLTDAGRVELAAPKGL